MNLVIRQFRLYTYTHTPKEFFSDKKCTSYKLIVYLDTSILYILNYVYMCVWVGVRGQSVHM